MLKKVVVVIFACMCTPAVAGIEGPPPPSGTSSDGEVALFIGLSWTFGNKGTAGVTAKILSTNEPDKAAATAGVTYNFDGSFGCDLGLAYNFDDVTATASYDFCKTAPQIAIGGRTRNGESDGSSGGYENGDDGDFPIAF